MKTLTKIKTLIEKKKEEKTQEFKFKFFEKEYSITIDENDFWNGHFPATPITTLTTKNTQLRAYNVCVKIERELQNDNALSNNTENFTKRYDGDIECSKKFRNEILKLKKSIGLNIWETIRINPSMEVIDKLNKESESKDHKTALDFLKGKLECTYYSHSDGFFKDNIHVGPLIAGAYCEWAQTAVIIIKGKAKNKYGAYKLANSCCDRISLQEAITLLKAMKENKLHTQVEKKEFTTVQMITAAEEI